LSDFLPLLLPDSTETLMILLPKGGGIDRPLCCCVG
jgi:hypothetical protein